MSRIGHWVECLAQMGYAPARILEGTGLKPDEVSTKYFRPSSNAYRALLRNIVNVAPPGIGLELGKQFRLADIGLLGYAALSSSTMRDVANLTRKFHVLADVAVVYKESVVNGEWTVTHTTGFPLGEFLQFHIEELLTRSIIEMETYTGVPVRFKRLDFAHPEPGYADKYRELLSCPVRFGQRENVWVFDDSYLELPIKFPSPDVAQLCEAQCDKLLARLKTAHYGALIREKLVFSTGGYPSLAEMAALLGTSVTTLQRNLRDEGETYAGIVDALRKDVALEQLADGRLPLKQISYQLGFSDVHNFHRAFKRWTGMSPTAYREGKLADPEVMPWPVQATQG